jgi:hypothetical protein
VLGAAIVLTAVALIAAVITARKAYRPTSNMMVVRLGDSGFPAASMPVIVRKGSPGFPTTYRVIPGDSLWKISVKMEIRGWERWHEANPWIKDPNRIYPGQELTLPAPRIPSSPSGIKIVHGIASPVPIQAADNAATDLAGKDLVYDLILQPWFRSGPMFSTDNTLEALAKAVQTVPRKLQRQSAKSAEPKLSDAGTVRRTDGVFLYRREMGAPFTRKRDAIRAIEIAPVDNAFLVDMLLASLGKEKQTYWVKPGQKIALLLFDDYRWVKNARWVGNYEIEAEAWPPFLFDNQSVRLVRGLRCYNFMIIIEPPPVPQEALPPPIVPKDNVPITPPPIVPKDNVPITPPPIVPKDNVPVPLAPLHPFSRPSDWDMSVGTFAEHYYPSFDRNKVYGDWVMTTLYGKIIMDQRGSSHSFGVAGGGNWHSGLTGDDYRYHGLRGELDSAYRYRFPSSPETQDEFIARLGIGQVKDTGSISPPGSGGRFDSKQKSRLAVGYLSFEHNRDPKFDLFPKVRYSLFADVDIGGKREDTWSDKFGTRPVDNPRADKSKFVGSVDAQIIALDKKRNAVLAAGGSLIKYAENDRKGARIEAGLDFWKKAVELRLNQSFWRHNNPKFDQSNPEKAPKHLKTRSRGIGVTINVSNLWRNIFGREEADFTHKINPQFEQEMLAIMNE